MQVKGCYDILKHNGVRLEDVLKWFFEEYLPQEFNAYGFRFNPPSEDTTMVEHIRFSNLSGFVKEKYAYGNNDDIQREQFLLFSNQSLLGYIEKLKIVIAALLI